MLRPGMCKNCSFVEKLGRPKKNGVELQISIIQR